MSCITQLLELKGDRAYLPVHGEVVIEGGGTYKDHEYLIVFTSGGHRCGYVATKLHEHEHFYKDHDPKSEYCFYPNGISCHGGCTFYEDHHAAKDLLPTPCNDFWIGFDAAHLGDKADLDKALEYFSESPEALRWITFRKANNDYGYCDEVSTHKSFQYMERECQDIIDQLINLPGVPA